MRVVLDQTFTDAALPGLVIFRGVVEQEAKAEGICREETRRLSVFPPLGWETETCAMSAIGRPRWQTIPRTGFESMV